MLRRYLKNKKEKKKEGYLKMENRINPHSAFFCSTAYSVRVLVMGLMRDVAFWQAGHQS
jgi:hypothetical protein